MQPAIILTIEAAKTIATTSAVAATAKQAIFSTGRMWVRVAAERSSPHSRAIRLHMIFGALFGSTIADAGRAIDFSRMF